ncbi:uncharacterized protein LAESUDRAFT_726220, partial [Laetiporus sulphureus 93-53]
VVMFGEYHSRLILADHLAFWEWCGMCRISHPGLIVLVPRSRTISFGKCFQRSLTLFGLYSRFRCADTFSLLAKCAACESISNQATES